MFTVISETQVFVICICSAEILELNVLTVFESGKGESLRAPPQIRRTLTNDGTLSERLAILTAVHAIAF